MRRERNRGRGGEIRAAVAEIRVYDGEGKRVRVPGQDAPTISNRRLRSIVKVSRGASIYEMAAARKGLIEVPSRRHHPLLKSELHRGHIFMLDKELLARKSGKIARQLQKNPHYDDLWRDVNTDEESMELLAKFCHGYDIDLSPENVVPLACVAKSLDMTDTHCPNNLLSKTVSFFEEHVMHSWDNSIKAIKCAERVLRQADELGLLDCCVETLILKALEDPRLLGEPLMRNDDENEAEDNYIRPNTRRKLFVGEWKNEDLTTLPLKLYASILRAMIQRQVPPQFVAANLFRYAKNWTLCKEDVRGERETIEILVRLIPQQTGLLPCTFLCEMLRLAIVVEADAECRNTLELRIGMQLEQAETKDLVVACCHGYEKYDAECLRRIVSNFYSNGSVDNLGALRSVAELMEEFLAEIAADIDLKTTTFLQVAELSAAAAEGANQRSCDGMYRALDVFLDKHRHLTESEKEDLCGKVLDCNRLSGEALQHAASNERLPLRVVMHALFASQLRLREAIPKVEGDGGEVEEEVRAEMEKMGSKVSKLERECNVIKKEMARNCVKREKVSVWREMKRKFGCMTTTHHCDCHVKKKKVHPR